MKRRALALLLAGIMSVSGTISVWADNNDYSESIVKLEEDTESIIKLDEIKTKQIETEQNGIEQNKSE